MNKMQVVTFTVEGNGLFPFDMLRYDSCWPKSEKDSGVIESTTLPRQRGKVQVTLLALSYGRTPTVARWKSFGWAVVVPFGNSVAQVVKSVNL